MVLVHLTSVSSEEPVFQFCLPPVAGGPGSSGQCAGHVDLPAEQTCVLFPPRLCCRVVHLPAADHPCCSQTLTPGAQQGPVWDLASVREQDATSRGSGRAGVLGLAPTACGYCWDRDVPELAPEDKDMWRRATGPESTWRFQLTGLAPQAQAICLEDGLRCPQCGNS